MKCANTYETNKIAIIISMISSYCIYGKTIPILDKYFIVNKVVTAFITMGNV